jgi:hypothetical protein
LQTVEGVSAQAKYIGSISAALKTLLLPEIPAICEALDRFQTQRVKRPATAGLSAADRLPVGQHPGSHVPQRKTAQAAENDALENPVPLKKACCPHLQNLAVVYSLQLITDLFPDRVLYPAIENPEPNAPRIIPIKADQPVPGEIKAIAVGSGALDFKPKKYNAFRHPAGCRSDLELKPADANDTIYVVFRREAYPASRRGFISLQDAVSKVRNYHNLGKLKGRILNIKG